jgi:hypothetical protein
MSGWIKIHRSITSHWLYSEKRTYSKLEAWYDILITVNYLDNKVIIKGKLYEVKRGESILSFESWANRWNWDKSKVRRFFTLLQKDEMIEFKCDSITTHLTVCKYESYQGERNADETQTKRTRNADNTNIRKKENKELLFTDFWKVYDKSVDRKKCLEKFVKLPEKDIQLILEVLPIYIIETKDKKFRKNPLTWLNGNCWLDIDKNYKPTASMFAHNEIID